MWLPVCLPRERIAYTIRFWILACLLLGLNVAGWWWAGQRSSTDAGLIRVLSVEPAPGRTWDASDRVRVLLDAPGLDGAQIVPASLFTVEPAVAGTWSWAGPESVELALHEPLAPLRVFKLRAHAEFAAATRRRLRGDTEFELRTRAMAVQSANWARLTTTMSCWTSR